MWATHEFTLDSLSLQRMPIRRRSRRLRVRVAQGRRPVEGEHVHMEYGCGEGRLPVKAAAPGRCRIVARRMQPGRSTRSVRCRSEEEMRLVNLLCHLVHYAGWTSIEPPP